MMTHVNMGKIEYKRIGVAAVSVVPVAPLEEIHPQTVCHTGGTKENLESERFSLSLPCQHSRGRWTVIVLPVVRNRNPVSELEDAAVDSSQYQHVRLNLLRGHGVRFRCHDEGQRDCRYNRS
jgi:hypothetical protein